MALSKGQLTRQKMINLMYLVFIAMLALNISAEVLDGFVLINDNIQENMKVTANRNDQIYSAIEESSKGNSKKAERWFNDARDVKHKTDSLFGYIDELKLKIARETDGDDADVNNLKKMDNTSATSEIMFAPGKGEGNKLKKSVDNYRESILYFIEDEGKKEIISKTLSTEPSERARKANKSWLIASFENMPSISSITFLSELQLKIKQAEGEVMNTLAQNIDIKDLRVNELSAFVVPQSNMVMRGTPYRANIIMAAVDTTQRPRIVINGKELSNDKGLFEFSASGSGTQRFSGFIEMIDRMGNPLRRDFTQEYIVMEPMATIAPTLMDVVYAGIDNPVSISVPGVASGNVTARALSGGTLTPQAGGWIARPSASDIGKKFTISVSANVNGSTQTVATKEFRIRALPDPLPYILYTDQNGQSRKFRKGALARSILLNTQKLNASIDDGILDIQYTVSSFRTIAFDAMGNATSEPSDGANFSERQLNQIRRMTRGSQFIITGIKARGPDGEKDLYSMDVRVN